MLVSRLLPAAKSAKDPLRTLLCRGAASATAGTLPSRLLGATRKTAPGPSRGLLPFHLHNSTSSDLLRTFNTRFAPARTYSTAPHAEDASAQKPDAPAAEKAPEPPAEKPKRPWYRHPAFIVLILALLMGPSAVKLVREKLLQAALDSPVLAMFPPSVRKPVLNALALEQAGNPLQAAQWYYVALTKAIEENVDPQSEIITALIIRWAGLEAETGNPTKAMELYENLFWKLIKEPPSVESDGTTWKVEPAEARASRLDRAALMALYAAGAVEFAGHAQTERELYEQALMWNRRAVNAFLSKNGSAAAIGPETIDNDLEWIVDMAPDVADLAKLEYVPIFEEDLKRHAAELAAAKGIEAPPDVKEAAAKPAIFETLPKSPLKPYLRQSNNLTVLITAFNNISEYSFVLDTALRNPPVPKTKGDFYEVDPQTLLRALSYRLHGALLDLNEVHDPCGLSVQLAGIMETYANTGSIGAGSAEEFGKKARELAVFALEKKVANPISCVECVMSVSSILGGMFKALGDQDRARKYYKQLESDANNQLIAQFAGASQSGAQGQQQPSLAVLVPDGGAVVPLKEFAAFAAREAGEADKGR